jgi:hypothetical protein
MLSLIPDWSESGTIEELSKRIEDFAFSGPGFYLTKTDTLLVIPKQRGDQLEVDSENIWHMVQPEGTIFVAYCYRTPYHVTALSAIASAPVRDDKR